MFVIILIHVKGKDAGWFGDFSKNDCEMGKFFFELRKKYKID